MWYFGLRLIKIYKIQNFDKINMINMIWEKYVIKKSRKILSIIPASTLISSLINGVILQKSHTHKPLRLLPRGAGLQFPAKPPVYDPHLHPSFPTPC